MGKECNDTIKIYFFRGDYLDRVQKLDVAALKTGKKDTAALKTGQKLDIFP